MFEYCVDPSVLSDSRWMMCYLTSPKQLAFYTSFGTVLALLAVTAPCALLLGFLGAMASRSHFPPLTIVGRGYTSMVRGIPDIIFFLFIPIAVDQGLEWLRHHWRCPDWTEPIRRGSDFVVCADAKLPLSSASTWIHDLYGITLAVLAFAVVFGAFAANVLYGAMNSVPKAQLETAEAYGMTPRQSFWRILVPQMWVYALPGLSNLWQVLIKATPLLFLLGVKDIVFWAREMGGAKTSTFSYPHPDWRLYYFLVLLVFYLLLTSLSERLFRRGMVKLSHGQATMAGEQQRKAHAA
ncbi:MAG: ABC transporter permease subunit [Pseudomonadota bacterium]